MSEKRRFLFKYIFEEGCPTFRHITVKDKEELIQELNNLNEKEDNDLHERRHYKRVEVHTLGSWKHDEELSKKNNCETYKFCNDSKKIMEFIF